MEFRKMTYLDYWPAIGMDLRPKDKNEVFALAGKPQDKVLEESIANSEEVYVIEEDGDRITGVLGVCDVTYDYLGIVWMLTTRNYTDAPVQFVRKTKQIIDKWQKEYEKLSNYIPLERAESDSRFLELLGFQIVKDEVEYFYDKKTPFVQIVRTQ